MKFCLYQGTFNPPHEGHLKIAQYVSETMKFDRIIFIPAYKPPHKNIDSADNNAIHRLKMTELLVSDNSCLEVSDIEYRREKLSYTYDTITEIRQTLATRDKIGFIIGDDAFLEIETWYKTDKLKDLVNFIVIPRYANSEADKFALLKEKGYNYTRLEMSLINISSTDIRHYLKEKKQPVGLSEKVRKYIYENGLYTD